MPEPVFELPPPLPTEQETLTRVAVPILIALNAVGGIMILMAAAVIPKFRRLFVEMLGDEPLTVLTPLLFHGVWLITAVGLVGIIVYPLLGLKLRYDSRGMLVTGAVLLVAQALLLGATAIGLFLPFVKLVDQLGQ